jgi:hypothetical protein
MLKDLFSWKPTAPNIWKASQETADQTFGIYQEFLLQ